MGISLPEFTGSLLIGLLYDLVTGLILTLPLALHISFTNEFVYTKKGLPIASLLFAITISILLFTRLVPKDFSRELYNGIIWLIVLRFLIYLFLFTKARDFRQRWRIVIISIYLFVGVFIIFFNAVSEWFFWNEFASRYNFIAVDYLIYTNEVIGNIQESYPITAILITTAIISALILYILLKLVNRGVYEKLNPIPRLSFFGLLVFVSLFLALKIPSRWQDFSKNNYANQLAGNGPYDFVQAFRSNDLDFYKYYQTIPDSNAFKIVREELTTPNSYFTSSDIYNMERQISYPVPERRMNVVLISVESLSASFMNAFGNTQHLTPNLDSLARIGMLFTKLYASGTRTVRGLEALTLSIPPLPGQSLVKRPGNENMFNLGGVFRSKGYATQFIYGGYGYFDNMNYFFSHNGYQTIDRSRLDKRDIHMENSWGVADEDLFTMALDVMDENYQANKPFFSHIMTVSNHRPYTYPDNRIDISPATHSREGAVKYTDYAIGKFIREAAMKPWFKNTLFVIVADHCASSAGKTALPANGYHIPMIIYSPGVVTPGIVNSLTAQIDIAPTILGLLHFNYRTMFFGKDVLNTPSTREQAFISTYQGLGFISHDTMIVQMPVRKLNSYKDELTTGFASQIWTNPDLANKAIAWYQVAAWMIREKKYGISSDISYYNSLKD